MALPLPRDRDSVFGALFRARYGEDVDLSDLRPEPKLDALGLLLARDPLS